MKNRLTKDSSIEVVVRGHELVRVDPVYYENERSVLAIVDGVRLFLKSRGYVGGFEVNIYDNNNPEFHAKKRIRLCNEPKV